MRVVLDTNVIIAAFATRGLCFELFELCLDGHEVIISEQMLLEVKRNLAVKIRLPENVVRDIVGYLRDSFEVVEPELLDKPLCRDSSDNTVIGTALKGKAGFIITGDDDLLVLKNYRGINIVCPRGFWNFLKQGK